MTTSTATKLALVVVAAALLVVAATAVRRPKWHQLENYDFEQYKRDFGKKYADAAEHEMRAALFAKKLAAIRKHNAEGHSWKKGVNHMSDWTETEFKKLLGGRAREMSGLVEEHRRRGLVKPHTVADSQLPLPKSVDWRNVRPAVVSDVKNQGMCGSCWAHGATEQIESYWALATNQLFTLSTQETTACTPNPNQCGGTGGCNGATAELGFERAIAAGLTEEWQYPYTAYWGTTGACAVPQNATNVVSVTGYVKLTPNDQGLVLTALAQTGPLAVNVDASEWNDYESGVYTGCNYANNITIDHVVQAVGYGTDETTGLDYFLIRNSWSPLYGEDGYIRILRTSQAACGWDVDPQMGTGCAGGPPQMWACGTCGVLMDTSYPIVRPGN